MSKYERGRLVRMIDDWGRDTGLGIYMDLHPPGYKSSGGKHFDSFWHFSVINEKGELIFLHTSSWTLVPVDPESCNP